MNLRTLLSLICLGAGALHAAATPVNALLVLEEGAEHPGHR